MLRYALNPKSEKSVKVFGRALRISNKNSVMVCRVISGLNLKKGKELLERLINRKEGLNGKYYTNAAKEILNLLKSAESSAEFKGLQKEKLIIYASSHYGFKFFRPRRFKLRGQKRKITNIQIILEQK